MAFKFTKEEIKLGVDYCKDVNVVNYFMHKNYTINEVTLYDILKYYKIDKSWYTLGRVEDLNIFEDDINILTNINFGPELTKLIKIDYDEVPAYIFQLIKFIQNIE